MTKEKNERLLDKYQDHLHYAEGGIFSKKARKRLIGIARPYGGDIGRTTSNFWNRITKYVGNALVDLELFIEMADAKRVNEVITAKALTPILDKLLWAPVVEQKEPDQTRAQISFLLIHYGFNYLKNKTPRHLSQTEERTISEAVDLSRHLAQYYKPENERRFPLQWK